MSCRSGAVSSWRPEKPVKSTDTDMKEKVRKQKRTVILKGWKSLMKKEKEKRWKKGLTNGRQCGMIYKLSFERAMMFEKYTVRKSGNKMSKSKSITTIAQGNWSTLSIPNKVLANFTKTLVFKIELINFRNFFESLILAQDERWRRA